MALHRKPERVDHSQLNLRDKDRGVMEMVQLERKIEILSLKSGKLKEELGERVYRAYQAGLDLPPVTDLCVRIREVEKNMHLLTQKLQTVCGRLTCPHCGRHMDMVTATCCPYCVGQIGTE